MPTMKVYLVESTSGECEDILTSVDAVFERREDAVRFIESQQFLLAMREDEDGSVSYYDYWYADDSDDEEDRDFYGRFVPVNVSPTPHLSPRDGSVTWYVDHDYSDMSTSYRIVEMAVM